jgi:predicted nucleic acid-binding protein
VLCLSPAILDEVVSVLHRLGLSQTSEFDELLSLFAHGYHTLFSTKTAVLHVVGDDPEDDKFLACAVSLHAKWVITGHRPFLAVGTYMGIKVITPRQFLQEWSAPPS